MADTAKPQIMAGLEHLIAQVDKYLAEPVTHRQIVFNHEDGNAPDRRSPRRRFFCAAVYGAGKSKSGTGKV